MSANIITGIKKIEAAIAGLKTKGAALQQEMHDVACSVLKHVGTNGDVRVVQRLVAGMVDAMPEMSRVNALREWFSTFGPVTFDEDGQALFDRNKKTRLGEAMEKPFWKFKKAEGVAYQPLDIAELLDKTIKKIETDAKKANIDHSAIVAALKTQRNAVLIGQTAH